MRNFLVVCNFGNVRSVALAKQLKENGINAIAIGALHAPWPTMIMLMDWAENVIDLCDQPEMKQQIKDFSKDKYYDGYPIIGPDQYGTPDNLVLKGRCSTIVQIFK